MKFSVLLNVLWLFATVYSVAEANTAGQERSGSSSTPSSMSCLETALKMEGASLTSALYLVDPKEELQHILNSQDLNKIIGSSETLSLGSIKDRQLKTIAEDLDTSHWFSLCLENPTESTQNLVLEIGPPTLPTVNFFTLKDNTPFFQTGSSKPLDSRDIPNPEFGFKVNLEAGEQQQYVFGVKFSENHLQQRFYHRKEDITGPAFFVKIWDRDSYDIQNDFEERLFNIFVGVFLTLMFFNFLVFVLARQLTSLLYILWSSCIFILLLSINGRMALLIVPNYPQLSHLITTLFYPLTVFVSGFFFKQFLNLKNYPKLNLFGNVIIALSVPLFIFSYLLGQSVFIKVLDSLALTVCIYFCIIAPAYTLVKDGQAIPRYVLISLMPLSISILDRVLFNFGITSSYFVPYPIVVGGIIAIVLISFYTALLAYREKQAAQKEAVEQLNLSNQLKTNYNIQLEQELAQKTADIQQMNIDLKQKANKLLKIDESKSRFFANISHEFRTPLTLIEGPLKLLLEKPSFDEKSLVQGVLKNSDSLKTLIDQILLLSEIDEKLLDLKATKQNLVRSVQENCSQFKSLAEQKRISLEVAADRTNIDVYVDTEKFRIIINNLLSNAIKFTPEGGHISVNVGATVPLNRIDEEFGGDEYATISVSDTGNGIPADELPFVFDRYFQSESSELAKSGVGTGIGLALVKELVELHAGDVCVKSVSESEEGATVSTQFCVNLPLGRAHLSDNDIVSEPILESGFESEPTPTPELDEQSQAGSFGTEKQWTVLVVDDNDDMRTFIKRLLQEEFRVVTAADGVIAEQRLIERMPDLIVTDLMMPNRNGLEFVKFLKSKRNLATIPVIMLTARAGLHDRIEGLMAAVDDYLVKPFNGQELKVRIKNLLNKHAQFAAFYNGQTALSLANDTGDSSSTQAFIDKVKDVVKQRLMDPDFGVEQLASALHMSEATLRRRLAEEMKFTPAAFIRLCRLEAARHLIEEGNIRTLAELSRRVGFSKPSYFSSLYKKTFNTKVELKTGRKVENSL